MGKRWPLYASITAAAVVFGWLLLRADREAPKVETRICEWKMLAIDVRSGRVEGPRGDLCEFSVDGLQLSVKIFTDEDPHAVANLKKLEAAAGASNRPAFDVSPAALLSLPNLL